MARMETVSNPLLLRGRLIVLKRGNTNRRGMTSSEESVQKQREASKAFIRGTYRGRFVSSRSEP